MTKLFSKKTRNLALGLAFLGPNILGFLAFTVIPLVFSLVLAFSNWDLKLHNMFKDESIRFVFFDNFVRLFHERDFYRFLGNTLFFMMGIPLSIAGSLGAALLLSKDTRGGSRRVFAWLIAWAVMLASVVTLMAVGAGSSAFVILLCGMGGGMLILGVLGGSTVYRTLFFVPHFASGVAVYILWKKLYSPVGPVNNALAGPLIGFSDTVNNMPPGLVQAGLWVCFALLVALAVFALVRLGRMWREGDLGTAAAILPVVFLLLPMIFTWRWSPNGVAAWFVCLAVPTTLAYQLFKSAGNGQNFPATIGKGLGDALVFSLLLMVFQFVLLGFGIVFHHLPQLAAEGLKPPQWLTNYYWAKPAIMIMGLWGSIGSNNMLLYLAGLSNVPTELYEAADIDGASRFQRFWYVTWPQLAPVTFFILIMSVIGGLQGGFEMARTMTQGGPAGATTTLSYFIYTEGFNTGRLGYASAIAWTLFAMVFTVTMFNWKFGSRYVND